LNISILNQQKDLRISNPKAKAIIKEALNFLNVDCLGLNIHFVTKTKISKLHQEFFNDPSITDCITLPCDLDESEHRFLGDAFICPYVAMDYVKENGGDPYWEVTYYIMHTLLHLLGMTDTDSKSRKKMFKLQDALMEHLEKNSLSLKD
jgi:probable rRNA maturation factor